MLDFDPVPGGPTVEWDSARSHVIIDTAIRTVNQCAFEDEQPKWGIPVVLYTGRGLQLWFADDGSLIELPDDKAHAEWSWAMKNFIKWFAKRWQDFEGVVLDTRCSDLSRLARMPGSINQKVGKHALMAQPSAHNPGDGFLNSILRTAPAMPAPPPILRGEKGKWGVNLHKIPNPSKEFCIQGVEKGNRHDLAYKAAQKLREIGVPEDEARKAVTHGARLCVPPLDLRDAERAVRNAYRGF